MRRALNGFSGTVIGLDYRGKTVLAAHEPVPALNLGIVAKIDLSEIREPFIRSGLTAAVVAFLVVSAGTVLFFRVGAPIIERLEAYAQDLEMEVEERKQVEAEREELIAKLEAQNAELERFAYTVSHDLKSPLITIKGFVGVVRQDLAEGGSETVAEDLARISNAADKMDQLLRDLLELSRIGRLVGDALPDVPPLGREPRFSGVRIGFPACRGGRIAVGDPLGDRRLRVRLPQSGRRRPPFGAHLAL